MDCPALLASAQPARLVLAQPLLKVQAAGAVLGDGAPVRVCRPPLQSCEHLSQPQKGVTVHLVHVSTPYGYFVVLRYCRSCRKKRGSTTYLHFLSEQQARVVTARAPSTARAPTTTTDRVCQAHRRERA